MKRTIAALILVFILPNVALAKYNDLTIVITSCDKYAALWDPLFGSLFKHWPSLNAENSETPILLIGNKQAFNHPRVQMVNIPHETSWTDNLLTALAQVKTKYVLIALDDYWLSANVDEARFNELFATMQKENAAMLQVSANDLRYQAGLKHPRVEGLMYRDKYAHYKVSLQLAIWEKQALLDLLRPGENPWEFELAGTARSHGYPRTFLTVATNEPITYINATYQGHIRPEAIAHAKQNNFAFNQDAFPELGWFNPKLTAKLWQARFKKAWQFAKNPGLFYKF